MSSPKNGDYLEAYGYKFHWTPDHLTPEQMRPLMFSYDVLATEALKVFDQLSSSPSSSPDPARQETTASADSAPKNLSASPPPPQEKGQQQHQQPLKKTNHHLDLYSLLATHHPSNPTLSALWTQVHTIPPWVDWAQISRGQQVFYRYAIPSVISLTFQSLLGGMGSSRVSKTLSKTGGFSAKIARKRLLDTFQHVIDVTRDLDSIKPAGKGFISSLRVRLLHASVRRRITALSESDPSYHDTSTCGIPINDLDSIATIITFSATVVFLGFPRQGIFLRRDEILDYLALWRWIGYILGTPVTKFFSSPEKAKALMESLGLYELNPSETSQALANNIITGLQNQPPTFASEDFLRAEAHWLNGRELATALAVPRPSIYYFALVAGQCLMFMVLCYIRRAVPYLDRRNIANMKVVLHRETMAQAKGVEATHGFKYIPRIGKTTVRDGPPSRGEEMKMYGEAVVGGKGGREGRRRKGFWEPAEERGWGASGGVEGVYLVTLLGVSFAVGGVALWFGRGLVVGG